MNSQDFDQADEDVETGQDYHGKSKFFANGCVGNEISHTCQVVVSKQNVAFIEQFLYVFMVGIEWLEPTR